VNSLLTSETTMILSVMHLVNYTIYIPSCCSVWVLQLFEIQFLNVVIVLLLGVYLFALSAYSSTLKMEAVLSSEISVSFNQNTLLSFSLIFSDRSFVGY
jgi:hypothetical protein